MGPTARPESSLRLPAPSRPGDETAEQLYEHAPCGYLTTALDGTVLRVNGTLLRWLGYEAADLVGRRSLADLLPTGPRVLWLTQAVPQLGRTGTVSGVALDLVRVDGSRLPVLVGAVVAGSTVRLTAFDATERRAYEAGLVSARVEAERSEVRARLLQLVAQACATATTPAELGEAVTAAATRALDAVGAALWLPGGGDGLVRAAVHELPDGLAPAHLPVGAPRPEAQVWRDGEPVVVETPERAAELFPALTRALREEQVEAVLALPVACGTDRLGVLTVHLGRSRPVGEREREALAALGSLVGQALERTRLHAELERRALHDGLTRLPNRVLLHDRAEQALARAARSREPVALLVLDLDGFKQVNDGLGHAAGDEVLRTTAARLLEAVREGDTVARLGGDEFAVLCEGADGEDAQEVARRVRAAVALPVELGAGRTAGVTASVGVALAPGGRAVTVDRLLAEADAEMYDSKRGGRDAPRAPVARSGGGGPGVDGLLRRAIAGRSLVLRYQPVFDLRSGVVTGVEALCRLRHPDGSLLPPSAFLPVAERAGLLVDLGTAVLEQACAQASDWARQGLPQVQLAVNVAAEHAARRAFAGEVLDVVARSGCRGEDLVLEITESALLEASPATVDGLRVLRAAGVGVSLDDFGTRFASLHYVQQFPLSELKVDRSFVVGLPGRRTDAAIVRAVAQLAADLGVVCVAEGVETSAACAVLRELGVRGQGFLLGRPVAADDLVEHLLRPPLWS